MTIAAVIIIALHGLVHLIGFVKEFKLSEVKQISGPSLVSVSAIQAKLLGILWFTTAALFSVLAVAILLKQQWAPLVGITAIVLSQILLILYWKDAKFGTIANLLIITYIILHYYL